MRYGVQGEAHAPPVVLIHGLGGSSAWWTRNIRALVARGYRVYLVELVGYGRARGQRSIDIKGNTAALLYWLEALGLESVALVGHSMGGQIALRMTEKEPARVSALVLAGASGLVRGSVLGMAARRLPRAALRGRGSFVPRIVFDSLRAGLPNVWRSAAGLLGDDVGTALDVVRVPTLLIWGESDHLVPLSLGQAMSERLGAPLKVIAGAGHVMMVDKPAAFNKLVSDFLAETMPPKPSFSHSFTWLKGRRVHAEVWDSTGGTGEPLVIVPGLGCNAKMYRHLASLLAAGGRRVYVYEPAGHGWSEGTREFPISIDQLTESLAAWLKLTGLTGADLLGHSLGAEVALDVAGRFPDCVRRVVACAPTGIPENPSVRLQLWNLLLDLPRERWRLWGVGFRAYATCGVLRMIRLARSQANHTAPLCEVRARTLLIYGTRDLVIHPRAVGELCASVSRARVCAVAGAHALTDSHPEKVARLTLAFLNEV